ncbi:portal protein [Chitinasiproducens palmae]|uniref:Bacteriophage head to tail connecting protein n=1 Tax=Chitinasiproducens palmae TaxID=1770053 RepID=A0A1H2PQS8_9BURK|nr:portal protein [Chitinasiproducens palmae]SDV49199.1 Bacteriophage head to tail connecting protein [Chitinasiproducens palmae]
MDNDDASKVQSVHSDLSAMKLERSVFEAQWNEIVDFMLPRHGGFGRTRDPGKTNTSRMFDSTAPLALRNFTAAMASMITPKTQQWHRLATTHEDLADNPNVRAYLDQVTNILFAVRYRWRAGFDPQIGAAYQGLGAFGNGVVMIDEHVGHGIRYRNIPLSNFWFVEDEAGIVDKGIAKWELTARQAGQKFGLDKLPESLKNAYEKNPEMKAEFYHCVRPRADRDPSKLDSRNMQFESLWVCDNKIVQESGFRTFPFAVGRFYIDTDSQYGGSPGEDELPTVRTVNKMEKTMLRGAQKAVDPPLLLAEDGSLEGFDLRSGRLNWGGLDDQGREMVKPLQLGNNLQLGIAYADQKRAGINQGFYVTLFQILVEAPTMTATEVLQRAQEKGILLAPTMGRVQTEMLGPMIERELAICASVPGLLPPMPPELIEAGGEVTIEYDSPLNRAMRASEGTAVLQWIQQVGAVAQFDQRALKVVNGEEVARGLAEISGVPVKYMNTEDQVAQMDAAAAQQAQLQQVLDAAPVAAGAAKDLASAAATSQAAGV